MADQASKLRVMAAADDLLVACNKAIDFLTALDAIHAHSHGEKSWETVKILEQAVDKATG